MALTDDERRELAAKFSAEIAEGYKKRAEASGKPKASREMASTLDADAERQAEIARLKHDVLEQFHKDNNFVAYVDSRGQTRWLSPEEYERRRNRKRKKRAIYEPIWGSSAKRAVVFVAALTGAVLLGWFMAR